MREKVSLYVVLIADTAYAVADTLKRKYQERSYFSTLEAIDGLQVQRVFSLLTVIYHKETDGFL